MSSRIHPALELLAVDIPPRYTGTVYLPWTSRSIVLTLVIVAALIAGMVFAWRSLFLRWKMRDIPTAKAHGLFVGVNECRGVATGAMYTAPASQQPVIWYEHKIEEYRSSGKSGSWHTIHKRSEPRWIQLTDDTGSVWLDTTTAEIDIDDKVVPDNYWPLQGKRRHLETIVTNQQAIFTIGPVVTKEGYGAPFFSKDESFHGDHDHRFIITTKSEKSLARRKAVQFIFLSIGAMIAAALFFSLRTTRTFVGGVEQYCYDDDGNQTDCLGILLGDNREQVWALPLALLGVTFLLWVYGAWRRLAFTKERAAQTWSEIDVQLRRRSDLLPNLLATVKAYAAHEQATLERITQARIQTAQLTQVAEHQTPNDATLSSAADISDQQTAAGKQLIALAEGYPELKASEQFLRLQQTLENTEDRIALARSFYNDTILALRDLRSVIPYVFIRGLVPCPSYNMFEAAAEARTTVPNAEITPSTS